MVTKKNTTLEEAVVVSQSAALAGNNPPATGAVDAQKPEVIDEKVIELIHMRREYPQIEGGPTEAEVNPEEVSNWLAGGWSMPTKQVDKQS